MRFSPKFITRSSLIAHFLRHRPQGVGAVLGWIVVPLIGAIIDLYLLLALDINAKIIGVIWLVIGVALLVWLTRGFRKAPPQLSIDEELALSEEQ